MDARFELLTITDGCCLIRFRDDASTVLLASSPIHGFEPAQRTIEWLRSAVHKDWLYQIGRAYQGNGPMFTLFAPRGVTCSSPAFTSSDSMERAVAYLKRAAAAPVVTLGASTDTPPVAATSNGAIAAASTRRELARHARSAV